MTKKILKPFTKHILHEFHRAGLGAHRAVTLKEFFGIRLHVQVPQLYAHTYTYVTRERTYTQIYPCVHTYTYKLIWQWFSSCSLLPCLAQCFCSDLYSGRVRALAITARTWTASLLATQDMTTQNWLSVMKKYIYKYGKKYNDEFE